MAPRKNKIRSHSPNISLDEGDFEEETLVVTTRPRAASKKAVRSSDDWDVWQDTVRTQENDRVKQYMSMFQGKVATIRKKAMQDLRQSEESRKSAEESWLNDVRAAYGRGHTETTEAEAVVSSGVPLREAGVEVLGLLQTMLASFEQTIKELQEKCSCSTGCTSSTGESGLSPSVQAAWDRDHEEARRLLQYGRAYGDNLVHEIIVPQAGGSTSSPIFHADNIGLDRTGRSAIGLFPRSRATLVGGQTWGEAARKQMQALTGLIQTLPGGEKPEIGGPEAVSFVDC